MPPLPKKPILKLEPQYMNVRKNELQLFLQKLFEQPLLGLSRSIWNFLTIEEDDAYKKLKELDISIPMPKNVSELTTLDGKACIEINKYTERTCLDINNCLRKVREEFAK